MPLLGFLWRHFEREEKKVTKSGELPSKQKPNREKVFAYDEKSLPSILGGRAIELFYWNVTVEKKVIPIFSWLFSYFV